MELEEQLNEGGGSQINDGVQGGRATREREAEPSRRRRCWRQTILLRSSLQIRLLGCTFTWRSL